MDTPNTPRDLKPKAPETKGPGNAPAVKTPAGDPTKGGASKSPVPGKPVTPSPASKVEKKEEGKKDAVTEDTFDWAELPEPEDAPKNVGYIRGPRIDVEKEVPQAIRSRVEESLAKFAPPHPEDVAVARKERAKAEREGKEDLPPLPSGTPHYLLQECGTEKRAAEFIRLAKRYGKHRAAGQITVRGATLKNRPTVVRFSAKPFEKRETRRLPGSEQKDATKAS